MRRSSLSCANYDRLIALIQEMHSAEMSSPPRLSAQLSPPDPVVSRFCFLPLLPSIHLHHSSESRRAVSMSAGYWRKVNMIYVITIYSVRAEAVGAVVRSLGWGASGTRYPVPWLPLLAPRICFNTNLQGTPRFSQGHPHCSYVLISGFRMRPTSGPARARLARA